MSGGHKRPLKQGAGRQTRDLKRALGELRRMEASIRSAGAVQPTAGTRKANRRLDLVAGQVERSRRRWAEQRRELYSFSYECSVERILGAAVAAGVMTESQLHLVQNVMSLKQRDEILRMMIVWLLDVATAEALFKNKSSKWRSQS